MFICHGKKMLLGIKQWRKKCFFFFKFLDLDLGKGKKNTERWEKIGMKISRNCISWRFNFFSSYYIYIYIYFFFFSFHPLLYYPIICLYFSSSFCFPQTFWESIMHSLKITRKCIIEHLIFFFSKFLSLTIK